jgi:uncharacterized damage-inducible protein DinB
MDLLDRLLGHDAWTTRQLLLSSQNLEDEQLDRDFGFAHGTVRATFLHMIWNMEVWTDLMAGRNVRPRPGMEGQSISAMISRLDRAAADFATVARAVAARKGWDESFIDTLDNPLSRKSFGGGIAHLITHSMHHRAQLIGMLRQLGVADLPEGDVLSWEAGIVPGHEFRSSS